MKKVIPILCALAFLISCNGDVKVNEEKLNDVGEKLQKTVQKGADSVGSKIKKLAKKLDKDTTN